MKFGSVIKKLRLGADMTQERLAETLGVSPQAVSRWETNAAMPDISLFPVIANLFDVTTDYLLGVESGHREEIIHKKLQAIYPETNDIVSPSERMKRRIKMTEDILRLYPGSWEAKSYLVDMFIGLCGTDCGNDERKAAATRASVICEDIIANCPAPYMRSQAISKLCNAARITGEKTRAMNLASMQPDILQSREALMLMLSREENSRELAVWVLCTCVLLADSALCELSKGENETTARALHGKARALRTLIYDGDGPSELNVTDVKSIMRWVSAAADTGKSDLAFELLTEYCDEADEFTESGWDSISAIEPDHITSHESIFKNRENREYFRRDNARSILRELEREFPSEFRKDPRYQAAVERLNK